MGSKHAPFSACTADGFPSDIPGILVLHLQLEIGWFSWINHLTSLLLNAKWRSLVPVLGPEVLHCLAKFQELYREILSLWPQFKMELCM